MRLLTFTIWLSFPLLSLADLSDPYTVVAEWNGYEQKQQKMLARLGELREDFELAVSLGSVREGGEAVRQTIYKKNGKWYYCKDQISQKGVSTRRVSVIKNLEGFVELPTIKKMHHYYKKNTNQYTGFTSLRMKYYVWSKDCLLYTSPSPRDRG